MIIGKVGIFIEKKKTQKTARLTADDGNALYAEYHYPRCRYHFHIHEVTTMKNKLFIYLTICLVGALLLASCARHSNQSGEAESALSESSEEIKIKEAEQSSRTETEDVLTLEKVRKIVSDSETMQDKNKGRLAYIIDQLESIQKCEYVKMPNYFTKRVYHLYDSSGITTDTIELEFEGTVGEHRRGSLFYVNYNDKGIRFKEEVLFNSTIEVRKGLTLEKVREIVKQSETEEAIQEYRYQAKYVFEKLLEIEKEPGLQSYDHETYITFILESDSMTETPLIAYKEPFKSNLADPYDGDTVLYYETIDAHHNILTRELFYESKKD